MTERFEANGDDPAVLQSLLSECRRERDRLVGRARGLTAELDAARARIAELERDRERSAVLRSVVREIRDELVSGGPWPTFGEIADGLSVALNERVDR